jgi:PAS domain-containing protein
VRVVCAYCTRDLGVREPLADTRTSHGMCADCEDYYSGQIGQRLGDFLDRLGTPVLVVDKDGRALAANRALALLVGKTPETLPGLLGGEVMDCERARLPGGCGKTVHCPACAIRNSVAATWADGATRSALATLAHVDGPLELEITTALEPGRGVRVTVDKVGKKR